MLQCSPFNNQVSQIKRKSQIQSIDDCPSSPICSANMCPLDPYLSDRIWYPDEEICRRQGIIEQYPWIRTQKKIANRTKRMDRYFNIQMLERNCIIGKGMVGLDPDRSEEVQLESWLRNHPPKREWTEEEKAQVRKRFEKMKTKFVRSGIQGELFKLADFESKRVNP